ncbi:hypothetical protein [Streptomyces sp. NPDC059409]|uniref:hypothetical protein n=1 Tax=Streptomyces sp. NPDC059409 TaxID=3346824 RepID=UPI0036BA4DEA
MSDSAWIKYFNAFLDRVLERHDDHLCNEGPDQQRSRMIDSISVLAQSTTLRVVDGLTINLFGFGTAPVTFQTETDRYVLLSDVAEELGWPLWEACEWAEREYGWAIRDQRQQDEERGDGRLGYDLLRGHIDLQLDLAINEPDAGGNRWHPAGDWLISEDRIMSMMCASPWSEEFFRNTEDAMNLAFTKHFGDKLKESPTYYADGTPTGRSAADMFHSDLTEEEARRKANRGPALDIEDGR